MQMTPHLKVTCPTCKQTWKPTAKEIHQGSWMDHDDCEEVEEEDEHGLQDSQSD